MDYLFGYPGGAVLPLYDTFYDGKIKHILEALLKENVDYLFGYPGGAVLPLYDTFYDG